MTCYVDGWNPKTKKQLREAVASGKQLGVIELTPMGVQSAISGTYAVCGPKYPEPHKWYATCAVKDGKIVSVK
jgi:hypothetical protein